MKVVIIDMSCYAYRAFFGSPQDPAGRIRAMISSALNTLQPDRAIVALDAGRETFRNEIYPAYKSNRAPAPEGYSHSCPSMTAAVIAMGIKPYSVPGFESDDIIGTLCEMPLGDEKTILSRDKDFCQLVNDNGVVNLWYDGKYTREAEVINKFGVHPSRVIEVMGLMGDSADGIPGVPGIGQKTAIGLIQHFQTLESLFDNLDEAEAIMPRGGERIRKQLEQSRELALLSRTLATIKCDVPLGEEI